MNDPITALIFGACYLATVAVQTMWLARLSDQVHQLRADLDQVRRDR
jgi:hypothetical protein